METRVVVTAEDVLTGKTVDTNTAYYVYIALNSSGRPTAVPALQLDTEEEQDRMNRGAMRQAHRLRMRE